VLRVDLAVVGGGPAGSIVAREAARGGLKVVLLERAPNAPLRCTGIISTEAGEELGIPGGLVLERLVGVVVHGPQGTRAVLTGDSPKALVLDRVGLDKYLRNEAREAGATVWEGVSAKGWDHSVLFTSEEKLAPELLVGADGALSGVARWAGLPPPQEILAGYQAEVEAEPRYPGHAEIFLDPGIAPGFFAWAVPAGKLLRVGLVTHRGGEGYGHLKSLLLREFPESRVVRISGGLIPLGPPPRTATERVFLVGDAAAQTKPLTGGGLYYGGLAAKLLGRLLSEGRQAEYEKAWREKLGREIEFALRARRAYLDLSPAKLDYLVSLLRDPELGKFLLTRGDMDRPSRILGELRRTPHLWPLGLKVLKTLGGFSRFAQFLQ